MHASYRQEAPLGSVLVNIFNEVDVLGCLSKLWLSLGVEGDDGGLGPERKRTVGAGMCEACGSIADESAAPGWMSSFSEKAGLCCQSLCFVLFFLFFFMLMVVECQIPPSSS